MTNLSSSRRGLGFVWRVYPARILGLLLCTLVVAVGIYPMAPPLWLWLLMLANGLLWAHVALWMALRSRNPFDAEYRHLLLDSAFGSFWIVMFGLNPLPSCLMWMMLWMNNIAGGGFRLFLRGLVACVLGLAVGLAVAQAVPGWQLRLDLNVDMIYASLPGLVIYPLAMGAIAYRLAIQLHNQKELLKCMTRTDTLTGMYSRGYWEERARELLAQAQRSGQPLSLILMDVDHFKGINDTYGHERGDQILRQIAECLQANLREHELLARYGGEEFVLVMPNTNLAAAKVMAERLRLAVAVCGFSDERRQATALGCSISLGVAQWQPPMGFLEWLHAADKALYRAKHLGRNRSCLYGVDIDGAEIAA